MIERESSPRAEFANALREFQAQIEISASIESEKEKTDNIDTEKSDMARETAESVQGELLQRAVDTFREQFSKIIDEAYMGNKRSLIKMLTLFDRIENGTATTVIVDMYRWISREEKIKLRDIYQKYKSV